MCIYKNYKDNIILIKQKNLNAEKILNAYANCFFFYFRYLKIIVNVLFKETKIKKTQQT